MNTQELSLTALIVTLTALLIFFAYKAVIWIKLYIETRQRHYDEHVSKKIGDRHK